MRAPEMGALKTLGGVLRAGLWGGWGVEKGSRWAGLVLTEKEKAGLGQLWRRGGHRLERSETSSTE